MMKYLNTIDKIFILVVIISLIIAIFIGICIHLNDITTQNHCNCTVDFNGQQTSIEDALHMMMEGLSYDQADEVQIMINNSLNSISK